MEINKIEITFNNNFVRVVERDSTKNFNTLIDWMNKFNNNQYVNLLTVSSWELGSSFSLDKKNIKNIQIIQNPHT